MEPEQKKINGGMLTRIFAESLAVGASGGLMVAGMLAWTGYGRTGMAILGSFFAAVMTAAYFTSRVEAVSKAEKRLKNNDCCGNDDKPAP